MNIYLWVYYKYNFEIWVVNLDFLNYRFVNDDDFLVFENNYFVRYIEDCVKVNKLLEKEKYR